MIELSPLSIFLRNRYVSLASKYKSHESVIKYIYVKHKLEGYSREDLIKRCEEKFIRYPMIFSHKRYFYTATADLLRSLTTQQFQSIVKEPNVPPGILERDLLVDDDILEEIK